MRASIVGLGCVLFAVGCGGNVGRLEQAGPMDGDSATLPASPAIPAIPAEPTPSIEEEEAQAPVEEALDSCKLIVRPRLRPEVAAPVVAGPQDCSGVVRFPDPALEELVRRAADGRQGDLHGEDLQQITKLSGVGAGVSSLEGLQCLSNLEELLLGPTGVSDLSPVSGLTKLSAMIIDDSWVSDLSPLATATGLVQLRIMNSEVRDLSPLAKLPNLSILYVSGNAIEDLTPLQGIATLTMFYAGVNQIEDLTPLTNLRELSHLLLGANAIADIEALSALPHLQYVMLTSNRIHDLAPLAANPGIRTKSFVHLTCNPVDCADPATRAALDTIEARGGWIHVDCAPVPPF